jgi:hypothetical protein
MDTFQITTLCFLGIIAFILIGLSIIIHKAIVRHQASTDAHTNLLSRLIEVESAIKSALPAIERNTGAAHGQLAESLPLTAKASVDIAALMVSRLPSLQESISETAHGMSETTKAISGSLAILESLAKTHSEDPVLRRAVALEDEIRRTTAEIAALRKDLSEAVKF